MVCGSLSMWSFADIHFSISSFNKNSATLSNPTVNVQHVKEVDLAQGLANDPFPQWSFMHRVEATIYSFLHTVLKARFLNS